MAIINKHTEEFYDSSSGAVVTVTTICTLGIKVREDTKLTWDNNIINKFVSDSKLCKKIGFKNEVENKDQETETSDNPENNQ